MVDHTLDFLMRSDKKIQVSVFPMKTHFLKLNVLWYLDRTATKKKMFRLSN